MIDVRLIYSCMFVFYDWCVPSTWRGRPACLSWPAAFARRAASASQHFQFTIPVVLFCLVFLEGRESTGVRGMTCWAGLSHIWQRLSCGCPPVILCPVLLCGCEWLLRWLWMAPSSVIEITFVWVWSSISLSLSLLVLCIVLCFTVCCFNSCVSNLYCFIIWNYATYLSVMSLLTSYLCSLCHIYQLFFSGNMLTYSHNLNCICFHFCCTYFLSCTCYALQYVYQLFCIYYFC